MREFTNLPDDLRDISEESDDKVFNLRNRNRNLIRLTSTQRCHVCIRSVVSLRQFRASQVTDVILSLTESAHFRYCHRSYLTSEVTDHFSANYMCDVSTSRTAGCNPITCRISTFLSPSQHVLRTNEKITLCLNRNLHLIFSSH